MAAAAAIALAEGLECITLRRLAHELAVRPGLINHYFAAAEELVAEAFGAAASAELEELTPAGRPPGRAPQDLARFLALTAGERWDAMSRLWLNARHLSRYRPALRDRVLHQEDLWRDRLSGVIADGADVAASMQPTHCCEYTRADHTDNWSRRLGEERAARGWRCRDLLESGARVILGSDWPIAPFAPLGVMAGARHRRPSRDVSQPPHGLDQALTPLRALRGMTVSPAWAAGEEEKAGRLAVGYRADLTVLADNPLCVPDGDLAGLPVPRTVLGGRITHRAPRLS